ncbi:O-antigen ligase family protein [Sphingobacterium faecale]|uniref:O-antigen ligase family protein n=1 Tax=Sphingobacterium faecale TaxID=2803775 RepID=A0ABS1QY57_9SPHI|nr:O-antigen ligase family protein [Sphingobacterium faecale]MBL1407348.1 O-antigen ligase family protein [Sphingobacterium faecale]
MYIFLLYYVKIDSSNGRILIWNVSSTIMKDHWMTGIGLGRFSQEHMHYQKEYLGTKVEDGEKFNRLAGDVRFAFNDFLQIFIEGGILILTMFVFIVLSIILLLIVHISGLFL